MNETDITGKRLKQIKFEVCSACQNECQYCAHGEMRRAYNNYQLSIAQLDNFLELTASSGYFIDNVRIHGPGEPLIWKHINEGLCRLKDSGVIGTTFVATNGLLLHRLNDRAWEAIDQMRVSIYPNFNNQNLLDEVIKSFPEKIILDDDNTFSTISRTDQQMGASIPCRCSCEGPMFIDDTVFLYCGPPVFGAAEIAGVDVFKRTDIHNKLHLHYLDRFDESKIGGIDLCQHCWANANFKKNKLQNTAFGGRW